MRYLASLLLALVLLTADVAAGTPDTIQLSRSRLMFQPFDVLGFTTRSPVHALLVDSQGRLWIGSELKLSMYDGSEVHTYVHEPADPGSLAYPLVREISEGPDGTIWIGTWGGGIHRYDPESDQLVRIPLPPADEAGFDGKVWSMHVDDAGIVWIGSFTQGLFRYDPATRRYRQVLSYGDGVLPRANRIEFLSSDERNVWALSYLHEAVAIDRETLAIESRITRADFAGIAEAAEIHAAGNDSQYILSRRGLVQRTGGEYRTVFSLDEHNSGGANLRAMTRLSDGSLVIGALDGVWEIAADGETYFMPRGQNYPYPRGDVFWSIARDRNNTIFIGTSEGAFVSHPPDADIVTLGVLDDRTGLFRSSRAVLRRDRTLYLSFDNRLYTTSVDVLAGGIHAAVPLPVPGSSHLITTTFGADGDLYAGSENGFFHGADGGLGQWTRLSEVDVSATLVAGSEIWIGSYGRGIGWLDTGDRRRKITWADHRDVDAPRNLRVSRLHLDGLGNLWFGTYSGVGRLDTGRREYLPVSPDPGIVQTLAAAHINCFLELAPDRLLICGDGAYYVATVSGNGIEELRVFDTVRFLSSAPIAGARLRSDGNVMLFTEDRGVAVVTPDGELVHALSRDAGFPEHSIWMGAVWEIDAEWTALGTVESPLFVRHDMSFPETSPPPLTFSGITSFRPEGRLAWPTTADGLTFESNDRLIRFNYGLLDFLSPENNRYRFRMSGLTDGWIDLNQRRETTFTSLEPGDYTLEIEARNGPDPAAQRLTRNFTVLPPWWRTWWAYALYAFVVLGSLTAYVRSLKRKIAREREVSGRLREADRLKTNFLSELEEKVELATQDLRHAIEALEIKNVELDAAQQRALDASRLKSEFLANMSHEIRTPMNGVLGFTQLLRKSELDDDQREYVETIEKSAMSLLGIINDVLDVSKIEAGKLIIDNTGFDLRQCVADSLEALAPVAYEKNLELIGDVDENLPDGLRSDPTRLRQMITNLVGNAVKFTESGHVQVQLTRHRDGERDCLRIGVTDTGRGITQEDRERLFQAFERGSVDLAGRYTGTGLGLVITKKLCEAMGGRIELDSTPGKGTSVTLQLPLVVDRNPENRYGWGAPLAGRRMLVIDPHTQSREALRHRLAHWGAEVTALAEAYPGAFEGQELAVLGIERIRLGDMRGLRALAAQLPPTLPVLALAATIDREALRAVGNACSAACLSKMAQPQNQLRAIREALGVGTAPAAAPATGGSRLDGLHVLIADDNRINRWFLKKILELHGARVSEADGGGAVLRLVDDTAGVDIVLLDVHMPDIDGLEVARRLRARGVTRLPLLAVSANVQPETYEAALAAGINDYLLKPVEESKLVEAVLEWTGREELA